MLARACREDFLGYAESRQASLVKGGSRPLFGSWVESLHPGGIRKLIDGRPRKKQTGRILDSRSIRDSFLQLILTRRNRSSLT